VADDFAYDLSNPETDAKPHRSAPRAPKATVTPEQFQGYLANPSTIPVELGPIGKWASPEQATAIRTAWPILQRPTSPLPAPEAAKVSATDRHLDELLRLGEHVYGSKADPKTAEAVGAYFDWEHKKTRTEPGAVAEAQALFSSADSPIQKLKGPARDKAVAMISLISQLRDVKGAGDTGAAGVSPYEIMTRYLPQPGDTAEGLATKRQTFAREVEGIAQGFPSQLYRPAVTHILRARALGAGPQFNPADIPFLEPPKGAVPRGTQAENSPVVNSPDKVAPYGLTGVVEGQRAPAAPGGDDMGTGEAIGRSFLHGATALSTSAMAALAHAMSLTGSAPTGVPGLSVPQAGEEPESFGDAQARIRQTIGDDPAKLAAAHEASPKLSAGAEILGGVADPASYLMGPIAKSVGAMSKLSPAARALLGHAVAGAAGGAAYSASEGGNPLVGAGLGAATGGVMGAAGESLLGSPAGAKAIKGVVQDFADKTGAGTGEVAAKEAAIRSAAIGTPEMRAVVSGHKPTIERLGPVLVDQREALLKAGGAGAWKPAVVKVEKAIDAGDTEAVEAGRSELRKLAAKAAAPETKKLLGDLDDLFTKREILAHAREATHSGPSRPQVGRLEQQMEVNPNLQTALPVAGMAAGGNRNAARALAIGGVRKLLGAPVRTVQQGLAKLYLARQSGDRTLIQKVAEEAIRVGVPFALASKIANEAGADAPEQEEAPQ
jgi:hypothetical protein